MPVEELRTGQSGNQTLPVCHPLKTVSGWETASAFQPKSPKPLSPAGSGLWHPTSPVIPNGRSQPVFPLLYFFNHLPAEGWLVLEQYWRTYACILYFFLSIPSVRRLDYSCLQLKSRLPWPKVRIAAPVPCPPPVDLHSTQRAQCPVAAFPETPTCYHRGILRTFHLHDAHPLAPTCPPVFCPPACMPFGSV